MATAFTIGHSLTLAASALGWITVPSRPVEVLIAVSIGVGAIHSLRPIVSNGEAIIAGGFGLIHGLAFAGILDNYGLGSGTTASTLLGFNVGVELAQLATIALVFPSLLLLSQAKAYQRVRILGSSIALAAAAGWVIERIGIAQSPLAAAEAWAIDHPLLIVSAFAAAAFAANAKNPIDSPSTPAPDMPNRT